MMYTMDNIGFETYLKSKLTFELVEMMSECKYERVIKAILVELERRGVKES